MAIILPYPRDQLSTPPARRGHRGLLCGRGVRRSRGRGLSGGAQEQPVFKIYTKTDIAVNIHSETRTTLLSLLQKLIRILIHGVQLCFCPSRQQETGRAPNKSPTTACPKSTTRPNPTARPTATDRALRTPTSTTTSKDARKARFDPFD